MAEAKPKYPGADSEEAFLEEARERFQQGVDYDRENRDAALDDMEFLAGKQWDDTVERARTAAGKPCLIINRLPQFVAQVVGDLRINKPGIKVRPAEDGDDKIAETRQGLIRAIEHQSKAQGVYANAGTSQVGCGLGAFRVALEYAADDVFDRDIRIKAIRNPFSVVWDAMMQDGTGKDARFCFVVDEMPRKAFEEAYPDAADTGELSVPLQASGWCTRDVVRVTEYWLIKEEPVTIHMLPDGQIVEKVPQGVEPVRSRETVRKSACMYLITGHKVLEGPYELPINRVPIFRVPGWEVSVGDKIIRWGLVRFAKDPQRLMNFWRSISAELLASAPKQQWLLHETQDGLQDDFRNAHKSGDTVLTWSGAIPPERIDPPAMPSAVLHEAALNAQDMKDVTGLHDASLGAQSNETSGKAIMARDRQGDVATYIYPDNLREAIGECGRVVNDLIPVVYDTARTLRVLGEDETSKQQRVNDPNDPESLNIGSGKYDTVVEAGPSYSTKRVEAAESMMQFVQAVPSAAQVAGDLIAKAQDWPMAEQIGDRLKKMMPPQITEGEEEPTPEEQQAKQAAMQQAEQQAEQQAQMQQQAVQLGMAEQQAKIQGMQADAALKMAQAQNVGVEQGGETPLDQALKLAELRKAEADAVKAEAEAVRAQIAVEADKFDLQRKPLEAANAAADLENKINPPEPEGSKAA